MEKTVGLPNPGGIFPLPGVNIPGVDNPSIPNPFDLFFDKFKEVIHDWMNSALNFIVDAYVHVPMPDNSLFSYYYSNSLGLASMLIVPLLTILILVAYVRPRRSISVVQMIGIAILFGLVAPGWIGFCDSMRATGIQIADHIQTGPIKTPKGGNDLVFFPPIGNILADVSSVVVVLICGGILVLEAFFFALVGVLVKIIGPLALIIYPINNVTKKIGNWVIAIGLVSLLFVTPAGKLGLVIGAIGANTGPMSNYAAGQILYIISGFAIAFALPIWLVFMLHNKVEIVAGDLGANVRGSVDATLKQAKPVSTRAISAANKDSMRVPAPVQTTSATRTIGRDVAVAGITVMSGKKLIEATGKTSPVATTAIAAHSALRRRRQNSSGRGGDSPS